MRWPNLKRYLLLSALLLLLSPLAFSDTGAGEKTYTITDTELKALRQALTDSKAEIEKLQESLKTQEAQLKALQNNLEQSKKKIEELLVLLETQKEELTTLSQSLTELKSEIDRIKAERDAAIWLGIGGTLLGFTLGVLLF